MEYLGVWRLTHLKQESDIIYFVICISFDFYKVKDIEGAKKSKKTSRQSVGTKVSTVWMEKYRELSKQCILR